MSVKSHSPTLVGLMIDVSSSMGRDWKDRDGRKLPQIEMIKDVLNREAQKIKSIKSSKLKTNNVELFCVGMGFRRPMKKWRIIATAKNKEIPNGTIIESNIDEAIVCDILALTELIPSRVDLQEMENQIETKWSKYSEVILQPMKFEGRQHDDLASHLQETLRATALKRLDNGIRGRLLRRLTERAMRPGSRWLDQPTQKLKQWKLEREEQINIRSFNEGMTYAASIRQTAWEIFDANAQNYEKYVRTALVEFASQQMNRVLELLTLGHPPTLAFDTFDEEKALGLARQIYNHLEKNSHTMIARTRLSNRMRLIRAAGSVGGVLDFAQVQTVTEETAHKVILGKLRPFVGRLVLDIFRDALKAKARERFYEWIDLSTSREVTRPIRDIVNFLPDALEQEIYSGEFMFGAAPIRSALKKVSLRFTDKRYAQHRKTLVLISDGEFTEPAMPDAARLLQKSGVTIVSLCISNNHSTLRSAAKDAKNWSPGARAMFEMSSAVEEAEGVSHALGRLEYRIETGQKLFIKVSDSEALEDVLDALLIGE